MGLTTDMMADAGIWRSKLTEAFPKTVVESGGAQPQRKPPEKEKC